MARESFKEPFGGDSPDERRLPTDSEVSTGLVCGEAPRRLFNGLIHQFQALIGHTLDRAGITVADNTDPRWLTDAIFSMIAERVAAATSNPDTDAPSYVQRSNLLSKMPIYPEILTDDGLLGVVATATGTVVVPAGTIRRRGLDDQSITETSFTTNPTTTYHVRWSADNGLQMLALNDLAYNFDGEDEAHSRFDTTYDDALLARVETNQNNVASITALANKARLSTGAVRVTGSGATHLAGQAGRPLFRVTGVRGVANFGRTPAGVSISATLGGNASGDQLHPNQWEITSEDRYGVTITIQSLFDLQAPPSQASNMEYTANFNLTAF